VGRSRIDEPISGIDALMLMQDEFKGTRSRRRVRASRSINAAAGTGEPVECPLRGHPRVQLELAREIPADPQRRWIATLSRWVSRPRICALPELGAQRSSRCRIVVVLLRRCGSETRTPARFRPPDRVGRRRSSRRTTSLASEPITRLPGEAVRPDAIRPRRGVHRDSPASIPARSTSIARRTFCHRNPAGSSAP